MWQPRYEGVRKVGIQWLKSSFSTDSEGNCLELAFRGERVALRESDTPRTVLEPSKRSIEAFIGWQKSSFSTDSQGDCVELAAYEAAVLLRESDTPRTVIATTPARLRALLATVKARV